MAKKQRFDVLNQVIKDVKDREALYGSPIVNHSRVAILISAYQECKGDKFEPVDSIMFQILSNIARLIETPDNKAAWENIAGYAAIGHEVTT